MRHYDLRMCSTPLTDKNLKRFDCVVIATDHSAYDYNFIAKHSKLVVDTRDAMKVVCGTKKRNIVKA
jgi:UDP-N-acetyl-D-glucosamine dehydrogenase